MDKTLSTSLSLLHKTVLRPAGFTKKGGTFSRVLPSGYTELFNIQASQWNGPWGRRFMVNCGLNFHDLPLEGPWMLIPGTHWAGRLERVVHDAPPAWEYSDETVASVMEKVGSLMLKASVVLSRDLDRYRQLYLERRR